MPSMPVEACKEDNLLPGGMAKLEKLTTVRRIPKDKKVK